MFRNQMPRYEILSADAMATLDKGWRRLVSELGVEFMSQRALDLLARGRAAGRGEQGLLRPRVRSSSRSRRRRASSTCRRATPPTTSTSAATRWRSARSTVRRSCARATYAATRRWPTSPTSPSSPSRFPILDSAGGVICEPNDTPLDSRHLDMTYALATLTDKVFMGNVVSGPNAMRHHRAHLDPVRRRAGPEAGRASIEQTPATDLADQLQLAAALGRPDARRARSSTPRPTRPSCSPRSS